MSATTSSPAEYAKSHWRRYETNEDHAERVERAEEIAGRYFADATKRQTAVYDRAMADLRGLQGPRYERARIAAKAEWTRSTVEASDLYTVTCDEIMRDGEISESLGAEWDALCDRETVAAVMEAA